MIAPTNVFCGSVNKNGGSKPCALQHQQKQTVSPPNVLQFAV
jgi:hypothetical protein